MSTLALVGMFGLVLAMYVAGAALTTGTRAQRALGVLVGASSMLVAWPIPPEHGTLRGMAVVQGFVGTMRVVDLWGLRWSLKQRLLHISSAVDTRRLRYVGPGLDRAALFAAIAWHIPAWPALILLGKLGRPTDAGEWIVRWILILVFVYALTAAAYPLLTFLYRAAGFLVPPLHVAPAMARSVQEFWGERWNRTVSSWLGDTFFRPLARRRWPVLGAFAAFFVSAIVHGYIMWVAVSWVMGLWTLAFFLAQAGVIALERVNRVRSWPRWAGHAWTVAWMVGLSPLFTEPGARAFGY